MARDIEVVRSLQSLVLAQVGRPAPTGELGARLATALADLGASDDLLAAVQRYEGVLAEAAGTTTSGLREILTQVTAAPIAFLGPLRAAAGPLISQARALGVDLAGGVNLGPAGVTLNARAVAVHTDAAAGISAVKVALGHLPIDSIGARLDLGPLKASGGGYLDADRRDAGAILAADLGAARVTVALLLDAGGGAVAVFGLLRAEFRPTGIQLGLGFSLDAVGGLFGLNRSVDAERLRDQIADGSAMDALFGGGAGPAQIRQTLGVLEQLFPAHAGSHLVGPTLRLGWLTVADGSLARLDVGVIVLLPSGRVLLPGRIVVEVPGPGVPLVHLRLDVLGEIDVAGQRLALDAALVDSWVIGGFRITGTAAVRMSWGNPAVLLATVGGFYPGFQVAPATVPPQRRIGISLNSPIPIGLRLSLEGYVAVAAGTLQAGATLTVAFDIAIASITGSAGFDAIIQLSPLWFEASVFGSVTVRALGARLLSVNLHGQLTGPGPLVLTATARAHVGFVSVGGTKSFTLVAGGGADRAPFDGLPEVVRRELVNPANLVGEGGGDPEVVLAPRASGDAPLVAPNASLIWTQQAFPVDGPFSKADGCTLRHRSSVRVVPAGMTPEPVWKQLTTAAFTTITAQIALTVPPFDEREAGWRLAPVTTAAVTAREATTDHRTVILPVRNKQQRVWRTQPGIVAVPFGVHTAVRALDLPAALSAGVSPAVTMAAENWVVSTSAGAVSNHKSGAAAHAYAQITPAGQALPAVAVEAVHLP